jgi:NAD/NADP transhydrogenase beta subunit
MNHQNKAWWPSVKKSITMKKSALIWTGALFVLSVSTLSFSMCKPGNAQGEAVQAEANGKTAVKSDTDAVKPSLPPLDTALFHAMLLRNANGDSSGK